MILLAPGRGRSLRLAAGRAILKKSPHLFNAACVERKGLSPAAHIDTLCRMAPASLGKSCVKG